MNIKPRVSVVMSVYNGERYLREAIESILNQTFRDFEFIIINDGSTDQSESIIRSYDDPSIRLVSRENRGLVASLNEAITLARGEYLARMDADDISLPRRFAHQVAFLDHHPEVALVGTFHNCIDEVGKETGRRFAAPYLNQDLKRRFFLGNSMGHGSAMIRAEAIVRVGGYQESAWPSEDYELWLRIAKYYDIANLPEILYLYRENTGGVSATRQLLQEQLWHTQRQDFRRSYPFPSLSLKTAVRHGRRYKDDKSPAGIDCYRRYLADHWELLPFLWQTRRLGQWLVNLSCIVILDRAIARNWIVGHFREVAKWRRKRILLVRNAFSYGGAEKTIILHARFLRLQGWKPVVVTNVHYLQVICANENIPTRRVFWMKDRVAGRKYFIKYLLGGSIISIQYLWILLTQKPAVCLFESKDDQVFGGLAAQLLGRHIVWRDHGGISRDWLGQQSFAWFDRLYIHALSWASTLVTVCAANAKLLKKQLPAKEHHKITVCYNGVDSGLFKPSQKVNLPPRRIGMLSRMVDDKGVDTFLSALNLLQDNAKIEASLIGDGPDLANYRHYIQSHNLNVMLHPFTEDVVATLNALDVFVLPTKSESFPLAVLEAMACGRLVAVSRVGGLPEMITNRHDGFLFAPDNPAELAATLREIISLPSKRIEEISSRARQTVSECFDLGPTLTKLARTVLANSGLETPASLDQFDQNPKTMEREQLKPFAKTYRQP